MFLLRKKTKKTIIIKEENTLNLPIDLSNPSFLENPYPYYRFLREQEPCHKSASGGFLISRYDDVKAMLSSNNLTNIPSTRSALNASKKDTIFSAEFAGNILPFQDGAEHIQCRKALTSSMYKHINEQQMPFIDIARNILNKNSKEVEFDVLTDFATPYALDIMMKLFGFPDKDKEKLKSWSAYFFYLFAPLRDESLFSEINIQLQACRSYILNQLKKGEEKNSLSYFLMNDVFFSKMNPEVVADLCLLLFADGIENVDKQLAATYLLLLQYPEQKELLKKRPALIKQTVQESLRFESSAQLIPRICQTPFEIHGQLINSGETLFLLLAAANRDESTFEKAESFLIERADVNSYLSFGRGNHSCIGARFAQDSIEEGLTALLDYESQKPLKLESFRWNHRWGHRWLNHLVVSQ